MTRVRSLYHSTCKLHLSDSGNVIVNHLDSPALDRTAGETAACAAAQRRGSPALAKRDGIKMETGIGASYNRVI